MTSVWPNKSVQATAAGRFHSLALVFFIRSLRRPPSSPAAVPDLRRYAMKCLCGELT